MKNFIKILFLGLILFAFIHNPSFATSESENIEFVSASQTQSIHIAVKNQNDFNNTKDIHRVENKNLIESISKNDLQNANLGANKLQNTSDSDDVEKSQLVKYILMKNPSLSNEIAEKIYNSSKKYSDIYGVDIYIIFSMIESESKFNPNCIGNKVHGLMQIHENTMPYLGISMNNIYDIDSNISAGVGYLAKFSKKYNDLTIALICYSHGESSYINGTYSNSYANRTMAKANKIKEISKSF